MEGPREGGLGWLSGGKMADLYFRPQDTLKGSPVFSALGLTLPALLLLWAAKKKQKTQRGHQWRERGRKRRERKREKERGMDNLILLSCGRATSWLQPCFCHRVASECMRVCVCVCVRDLRLCVCTRVRVCPSREAICSLCGCLCHTMVSKEGNCCVQ